MPYLLTTNGVYITATDTQLASVTGTGTATGIVGAAVFTDVCDILANQGGSDAMGGFLDNWQTIATAVPCAIRALAPSMERTEGEKVTATGVYVISLPPDTVIDASDRILCNGITYEVQDRDSKISNQTTINVRARRIE